MRHRRTRWLASAWLIAAASPLAGQVVHGRVVDHVRRPLIGAMAELRDPAGHLAASALTGPNGNYQLTAPGPGRYFYRVVAIGYEPSKLIPVDIPPAGLALPDVQLAAMVMRLPDLVAVAHGKFCGKRTTGDDIFLRVLESAHTALSIIQATVTAQQVGFSVARIRTRTLYGMYGNYAVADTTIQPLTRWPIQSINPDTLRVVGFGRTLSPGDEATREYYGPDERVLFSDWFLASHCFTVDKPPRKHVQPDTLHLRFTPARKTRLIDVSGDLVLDGHDLSLLAFSFTLTHLPNWMPDAAAGGDMQFARLPSGLWMTRSWAIWAPVGGVSPYDQHISVAGEVETYGWVLRAFNTDSSTHF